MVKHPNVLRFEPDPVQRRVNQHWREKYGTLILRLRQRKEAEQARTDPTPTPDPPG